ncbi:3-keto-disaccharide hydrolase [Seonamhaeicola marinus]|uniref:DUF1080 domain-containing protein n=1 Tax=Seonamhaeicola marinus TaxID=1912246 RepID=A0A5D0J9T7_9FLAO|nr:DUF1080 domain-containing protein [Seonamhaeicola marinus]TYA92339.1 DUF1080 domain-containing protein [Seonamhaeicola marinus]
MHHLKIVLLLLLVLTIQSCKSNNEKPTENDSAEWVSLFNGKNLEGWEVNCVEQDKHYDFFKVIDGAIVINSIGVKNHDYMWLATKKEYGNFELTLQFQTFKESTGNSGIQIRSRYDHTAQANKKKPENLGWLDGPQVDIHPKGPWRNGLIYDETRGHQRWIHPSLPNWNIDKATYAPKTVKHYYADESPNWNSLVIRCKDNHITTYVNEIKVSDFDGTGILNDSLHKKYNIDKTGVIALQLHRHDELKIAFKAIKLREL